LDSNAAQKCPSSWIRIMGVRIIKNPPIDHKNDVIMCNLMVNEKLCSRN
jgi:hypothetical protein